MKTESHLRIINIFPQLLGTYGDSGNALILKKRAQWFNLNCEIIEISPSEAVPIEGDIYLLGGGEDLAQKTACELLLKNNVLKKVNNRKKFILAICAGYQILGLTFPGAKNEKIAGLGIIDAVTIKGKKRAVGEICGTLSLDDRSIEVFGFENHSGLTFLGPDQRPLSYLKFGVGNHDGQTDGILTPNIIGTYMHGPALARNPDLANHILSVVTNSELRANFKPDQYANRIKYEILKHH